jgi:hypothetical protein
MKISLASCLAFIVFIIAVPAANAATLYLSPTTAELNRGDSVKLSLRLDVDRDECVNAIDGVISYTGNIEPVDISRGMSIMSIWVEEPIINREARTITFAGGIPNGYCGRIVGDPRLTNNIIDIIFQSPGFVIGNKLGTSSDMARVEVTDATQAYLNDGFGTRTVVNHYGADIKLNAAAGGTVNQWGDIVAADEQIPEEFSIALERTENAFNNEYFITFNTTDKQSGIDHYEVIEEPRAEFWDFRWGAEDAPWIEARSPYVLNDQSLNSTIRVRAIDKAGNEYIASLVPEESVRTLNANQMIIIAVSLTSLVFLAGLALLVVFVRRRRVARATLVVSEIDSVDSKEDVPAVSNVNTVDKL